VTAMSNPYDTMVVVTGGGEEMSLWICGRNSQNNPAFSVDLWR